jgi:hypothetical protein
VYPPGRQRRQASAGRRNYCANFRCRTLAGLGHLTTENGPVDLEPGALLWLPRSSRRQFTAGPTGLRYLTVHRRRQAFVLDAASRRAG